MLILRFRYHLNANYAITLSAVFYVFTALSTESIPPNEGLLRRIRLRAPEGFTVTRFAAGLSWIHAP